jgi:hypothetical protein
VLIVISELSAVFCSSTHLAATSISGNSEELGSAVHIQNRSSPKHQASAKEAPTAKPINEGGDITNYY